jgi:hypothetical protein
MKKDAAFRLLMAVSIVALFGLTSATALARTWTDVKGRTISGKFVRLDGDKVVILSGGKVVTPRLSTLSQADRDFVRDVLAGKKTADEDKPSNGAASDNSTPGEDSEGGQSGFDSTDDSSNEDSSNEDDSSGSRSGLPAKTSAVQRDWRTSKGPVRGTFVRYFNGDVIIKRAGKVEQYSFWTLSDDDQQYVRDLLAARGMPNAIPRTRPAIPADDDRSSDEEVGSDESEQDSPDGFVVPGGIPGGAPGGIPGGIPGGGLAPGGMPGIGPGGMGTGGMGTGGMGPGGLAPGGMGSGGMGPGRMGPGGMGTGRIGPGGMGMGPGIGQGMGMPPGMGGAGIGGSSTGAPGAGGMGMGPMGGMPQTGFPSGGFVGSPIGSPAGSPVGGQIVTGGMAGSGMAGSGMGGATTGESMFGPNTSPPSYPRFETTFTEVDVTPPGMAGPTYIPEAQYAPEDVALGVIIIVLSVACPLILFVAFVGFFIWLIVKLTSRPSYPRTY